MKQIDIHPELGRALLESLPTGVALIDSDNRVIWANQTLAEMLERSIGDLLGKTSSSLSLPVGPFDANKNQTLEPKIKVEGRLVGISRPMNTGRYRGQSLLVVDRGHALVGYLNALSTGMLDYEVVLGGVLNSETAQRRLETEISRSRRYGNPLSCLVCQVLSPGYADDPELNTEILLQTARIIKGQLRWVDVIGQNARDSLMVVLPETSVADAGRLAKKLTGALEVEQWTEGAMPIEFVWGISTWRKGDDVQRLLLRAIRRADRHVIAPTAA